MPKKIKNQFTKPPAPHDKEKKAAAFLNFDNNSIPQKEPTKILYLRVPKSYWDDIQKITATTGIPMNATCLELLRPAIKKKLKELTEEG
jgi:hypothetical protein